MKKYLLFAAALLGLVACNQNNEPKNEAPRKVTLHATVENGGAANGPARIAPVDPTAATVEFAWEENDQVIVKTNTGAYTLDAFNISGYLADFEGEVAGDLTSYTAYYGYDPDAASQTIPYVAGSFKPCVYGNGSNENFTLNQFYPVLKLQLTGAATLGKIEYLIGTDVKATMTIPGGIALSTSTASVVYLPVADVDAAGFTLKFYDNAATPELIMEKATTFDLTGKMGKIVTMPELEVAAAPAGPVAVDLGLSVKWASMNVGATVPEEYGDYFAWGETAPKTTYNWTTYKYCNGTNNTLTKYCYDARYGTTDTKTTLDAEDDAAHVNLGGSWRMPTKAEQDELLANCSWSWTSLNGVNGYRVTATNGNSIFLPAAGNFNDASSYSVGSKAFYLSSSLFDRLTLIAFMLTFDSRSHIEDGNRRDVGCSVRAVCE